MVLPLIPVLVGGAALVGVVFAIATSAAMSANDSIPDQLQGTVIKVGWISEGIVRGAIVTGPTAIIIMTLIWLILGFISRVTPTAIPGAA